VLLSQLNFAIQDVIPPYGLSLQKPSTLWPPPPDEMAETVQSGLRARIKQVMGTQPHNEMKRQNSSASRRHAETNATLTSEALKNAVEGSSVNVGTNVPPPTDPYGDKTFRLKAQNGEMLEVPEQVHFYTENHLLGHPLVSPALSYLGGLPPLLFIAGEAEVLRDEIIYTLVDSTLGCS
jgi:acetyl esterase/lipase